MRQILSAIFFFILSVKLTQGTANFTNATNASITTNSSSNSPNVTTNLTTLYIGAFFDLDSKSGYGRLPMAEQAIEEVNNNENILPGYRLELVPISTQGSFGFGQKVFYEYLNKGPKKIMLLGPGEDSLAKSIAAYAGIPEISLMQFSYGTNDLELASRRDLYPNFFRTVTSAASLDAPRIQFIKAYGWNEVGIIYGDSVDHLKLSNQLAARLRQNNINVLAEVRLQANDPARAIRTIKDKGIHVILGIFPFNAVTRRMICEAYRQKMYGPHFVWMLINSVNNNWWIPKKGEDIACSDLEMKCQIQNHFSFYHTRIIASKKRFYSYANKNRSQIIADYNARVQNNDGTSNKSQNFLDVYDAVWSMAFVLDQSRAQLFHMQGKVLENLTYGDKNATAVFRRNAVNLNFPSPNIGLSVRYYANGDRKNAIVLKQLVISDGKFKLISGGKYSVDTKVFTKSTDVHWFAGTPYTKTQETFTYRTIDRNLFIALIVLASLGIVYALSCLLMLVLNFKKKIVRNSGPLISLLIIIGCVLNYVTVILYGFDYSLVSTDVVTRLCRARAWTFAIGFTLSVGGLTAKLWIAYSVLKERSVRSRNSMTFWMLGILLLLVIIDVIILACWEGLDPLYRALKYVRSQPEYKCFEPITAEAFRAEIEVVEYCNCASLTLWLAVILTFKVLLLLTGGFLAWQTRRVYITSLNDTQHCVSCMFVVILFSLIGAIVAFTTTLYPSAYYGVIGVFIIIATTLILLLLFANKITRLTCGSRPKRTVRTVQTTDNNNINKFTCGAAFAKLFSCCACSAACCMAFCSCFLCSKLYACFRKIFGCKSHTHPSEGGGEDANADFYIGGVPQDKSSDILRLRNELREKNSQLNNLGYKGTVKSIWTQTMDDNDRYVWNAYNSDCGMSDNNASDIEGSQGSEASRRLRRAANKFTIFNQAPDYSHVQSKVNTGIRRTSISSSQQPRRGSRVMENFMSDEERRKLKANLAQKDEEIAKLRKELETVKTKPIDVKYQQSPSQSQGSTPTTQRIILVETPPTPIPPETTSTVQQLPVTAIPPKKESLRRKSIDATPAKPLIDEKTQDKSNKNSTLDPAMENIPKKLNKGSRSENENERGKKVSPGSSPGSEQLRKASRSKEDIETPANKETYDAKHRASLSQVTLSELPTKTAKSSTPPKAAGDVKGESEGPGSEEDKEKKKPAHRKISSWLFNDNENADKNNLQTEKDEKKTDDKDKGMKKAGKSGQETREDKPEKNSPNKGDKISFPAGGDNDTIGKQDADSTGGIKDKALKKQENVLQGERAEKNDRKRSIEILSDEGDYDDDDDDNDDDEDYRGEASSENSENSPSGAAKPKATKRGSRKGRGRRRKLTFGKLNWNAQSKIDSGMGGYKPRRSSVRIPHFKSDYSHVKSRVPSMKDSKSANDAASDTKDRRSSVSLNKTLLPDYYLRRSSDAAVQ
ncbi:uncharacterized protein [Montipora foliosa]|uniref:uncharacterized protein n=1 Tax=Montipora foliosa TaxID=591990 RepID=UPI0035F10A34